MVTEKISEAGSFEGYNFMTWLFGNWKFIKEGLKVGIPFLLTINYVSSNLPLVGLITFAGKWIIDTGEFYLKKVKLQ